MTLLIGALAFLAALGAGIAVAFCITTLFPIED